MQSFPWGRKIKALIPEVFGMDISIDKIFKYLSWDNDNAVQKRGIDLASQISNLSVLIMPVESKSIWENCAKVLINKSDEELQLYYIHLFEWLQDLNWPGAYLIYDRLLCVSDEYLLKAYQHSLSVAKKMEDSVWEKVLRDFLAEYNQKRHLPASELKQLNDF